VLAHPATLALFLAHGVFNLGTLSINSWMPTYFDQVIRLPPEAAKLHLTLPHVVATAAKLVVPAIGLAVRAGGKRSMLFSRRFMTAAGFVVTALALQLLPPLATQPPWFTTAAFSLALAGTGLHAEGFRANYLDVTSLHVGAVSSLGNCISSVAAMCAPLLVGELVSRYGSWTPVWALLSASSLAAAACFALRATTTPVEASLAAAEAKDKAA